MISHLRNSVGPFAVGVALWPCIAALAGKTDDPSANRPNVILIMADDIGQEAIGCYGGLEKYKTPNLDRLAREGMRFRYCYSGAVCTPTRVQLMTGKYNHRNYEGFANMGAHHRTFGNVMQEAGYRTAMVGKWQLGGSDRYMDDKTSAWGFDEYCFFKYSPRPERRFYQSTLIQNGEEIDLPLETFSPDKFVEYIERFLERNQKESFFVYYPMSLVHSPFIVPPHCTEEVAAHLERYRNDPAEIKSLDAQMNNLQENYPKMVEYMDRLVGRIVSKVDQLGLRQDTIILFTGDNGSPGYGKGKLTEAGTNMPLIASWQGTTPTGGFHDAMLDFCDFYATCAEIAGAKESSDGVSFLPLLKGAKEHPRGWAFNFSFDFGTSGHPQRKPQKDQKIKGQKTYGYFVRDPRWKLYDDGRLYDMSQLTRPPEQPWPPREWTKIDPILPARDTAETQAARKRLEAVFTDLQVPVRTTLSK